jgi:hypothetical protein
MLKPALASPLYTDPPESDFFAQWQQQALGLVMPGESQLLPRFHCLTFGTAGHAFPPAKPAETTTTSGR